MPYIHPDDRPDLDGPITTRTPGELNYVITKQCLDYLDYFGASYDIYNDIIGVLECAKLEFYRRAVSAYEDKKIEENGDVYV